MTLSQPGAVRSVVRACGARLADRLSEESGFVDYQVMDTGDGTVTSVTIFEDEERCLRSNDMAAEFVREHLRDFQIERLDMFGGEVMVSRAAERVLEPAHH